MQVYEVKNDIAEILYAPDENNLFLSDFLFLEDNDSTIVSQVTDIATTEQANINIATVQFYLSVDKSNRLTKYNGHTPSKNAEVGYLDASEIVGLFRPKTKEILWGNYIRDKELPIATDLKFLSSNSCTVCDRAGESVSIVKTLLYSLNKANSKVLLLDFDGKYKRVKTSLNAVFGEDFRIPLDNKALDYIFEHDLNDCPLEAKAVIQNIILEIQKYVESIPQGFLPFNHFINIVTAECKNSKNAGLMIFCNKLLQYKQKKIFADDESQFSNINNCISSFKLDISNVDTKYHNLILNSVISHIKKKFYVITDVSEENLTSGTIKRIYENQTIRLIPIISHDDKYLNKIKSYCKNLIIFAPAVRKKTDEPYSSFMDKLSQNEFILWGDSTLFIPLIVIARSFTENQIEALETEKQTDTITDEDLDSLDEINGLNEFQNESTAEIDNAVIIDEITEEDLDELESPQEAIQASDVEENQDGRNEAEQNEIFEAEISSEENTITEINAEEDKNNDEHSPAEIVSDTEDVEVTEEENPAEKNLQQQDDTNCSEEEIENINNENQIQTPPAQDDKKTITPQSNTPAPAHLQKQEKAIPNADELPIYEPKEIDNNDTSEFKEGNRVIHAKYGEGTVEKIIAYGNKTLCAIQFDNVGRRLLDPKITTIHKV